MGGNFDMTARIAARQHGRVTWQQLVDEGVHRHAIQRWLEDGRLHRVHDGVYAVGHPGRSLYGDYMAAVLACGDGAALSHRAAAYLLRLLRGTPPRPEVTVPTTAGRSRRGIIIHRVRALPQRDTMRLHGMAITTVPRTLLDLAPQLAPEQLTRACHEAWVHHDLEPAIVEACIARNPHKQGAAKLRRALRADVTLSELEAGFVALLRRYGLPLPRTNIDHHGDKVDCHWPDYGVTIELVSYRYHATRHAFEQDVARRRRTSHIAYSYGDVFERGRQTAAEVAALLGCG
jgi:predicted transcriptional regulator of viral defense system